MKHEIKIEFSDAKVLQSLIEKAYFEKGTKGKISGSDHYIKIDESDDVLHTVFKGLNNATVKIINDDVLEGSMRFLIDETQGEIRIYAASIYCIKEDKYSFY
jgi:hypothetical protein